MSTFPLKRAVRSASGTLKKLGEDVSEMLEYLPASFKVVRHVRPKMCCAGCDRIVQAPAPSPSHRSRTRRTRPAGACPHRQVLRSSSALSAVRDLCAGRRRSGSLDAGQVGRREQLLAGSSGRSPAPLCDVGRASCTAMTRRFPVLAPGTGKTKTGRLWTYVRDDRPSGSIGCSGSLVRLLAGPQGRTSAAASDSTSAASSRPTPTPASTSSMKTARFRKRPAWPISGASSTT